MWMDKRSPIYLLAIPFLWAGMSSMAALSFGIYEDFGLFISAIIGTFFIIRRFFATEKERWL